MQEIMIDTQQISAWVKNDELRRFYTSRTWRNLRADIFSADRNECQRCKARGKYSRAKVVHHVMHVRSHPELALSKHYFDEAGEVRRQLVSLCDACHEEEHPERLKQYAPKIPVTVERWD